MKNQTLSRHSKDMLKKQTQQQTPNVLIPINGVLVDDDLQVRNEVYSWKVEQYAQAYRNGAILPPIEVGQKGEGFILIDGFHRLAALKRIKEPVVEAIVTDEPESQWKWIAAKRNLTHGMPLRKDEIYNAFVVYMESKQYMHKKSYALKSYREIAADLVWKGHTTIRNWMLKAYPEIAKMIGDKNVCFEACGEKKVKDMSEETIEKIETSLEYALALTQTLGDDDGGIARGRAIEKAQAVLELMKQQGAWSINTDF